MTLTREQVEAALRMLQQAERDGASITGLRLDELTQAYRLALQALDMQPRPISEAPKDRSIYAFHPGRMEYLPAFWRVTEFFQTPRHCWKYVGLGANESGRNQPTHFIPRLPLPEGGKE